VVPEIVGGDEFEGAIVVLLVTTAVAAEVAVLDPLVLEAVTATRTVVPRSSMVRV
jgi:IS5 family transposase